MARSHAQHIADIEATRDCIADALRNSASEADVVEYTTDDGRMVRRNRKQARDELDQIDRQVARLQMTVNGRAANRVRVLRRP